MTLKRVFTLSLDPELADLIEAKKMASGKNYTEIFIEALKKYFGDVENGEKGD